MNNYEFIIPQDSTLQEIEQVNQINGLLDDLVDNNITTENYLTYGFN